MGLKINHKTKISIVGYSLLLLLLFVLKVYQLPALGLPDYDSVKSYQVTTEMLNGDFRNLYRHASPGFNFFMAGLLKIVPHYVWAEYVNCALMLLASFIFSRFVSREMKLPLFEALLLLALVGSSLTLTFLGRSLTFDGLGFLLFVCFLQFLYQSLKSHNLSELYRAAFFYGLMFTVDYKVLLLLPIIIVVLLFIKEKPFKLKNWLVCGFIIFLIFLGFSLVGIFAELPWYQYLKVVGIIPFKSDDHPNREVGFFNADVLYYLKYLLFFENPMLLIGILLLPFIAAFRRQIKARELMLLSFLAIFAFCLLAGMSLIQKAPRGLLYAYPLFYALALIGFRQVLPRRAVFVIVILIGISFNLYTIKKNIYPFTQTNYEPIASYLSKQKATKVALTVSNRLTPFLNPAIEVKEIVSNSALSSLKAQGFQYLLIDDYYKLTGIALDLKNFDQEVLAYPEPSLLSPVLGLEHSEFAGFSFKEALEINKKLRGQETHLRLIKL